MYMNETTPPQKRIHKPADSKRIRFTQQGSHYLKRLQQQEQDRTGRPISPAVAIDIALYRYFNR